MERNRIYSNTIYYQVNGSGIYAQTKNCIVNWHKSYLYDNIIISNLIGIKFLKINSHIVNVNNISNNSNDGIFLNSSTSNTISYNKITNNNWNGINLTSSSLNNKLQNNNINLNNITGIFLNSNSNNKMPGAA